MTKQPIMVNAFDSQNASSLIDQKTRQLISRRDNVLGPGYRLFYREPVTLVRGQGTYLYDLDGNEYLDAYNNVPCVGHGHPHVVEAVHTQMRALNTNTRYVQEQIIDYAERLLQKFPEQLNRVTFACTGSEANDLALRVARFYTGQDGVIVTSGAYHGLTSAVAQFSPSLGAGSPLGPHVRTIPAPDERSASGKDFLEHLRTEVRAAIDDLHRHGYGLAALFADSIFSSDGIFPSPTGFLRALIDEVHAAGGLYIADEVQPGFCRLGESWWGFQRHQIVPDIVTLGKPMGNGIPISATVFRSHISEDFGQQVRYFNTFGGSSVPIAAASAVIDVLEGEGVLDRVHDVGSSTIQSITEISKPFLPASAVRGAGYFIGVEIADSSGVPNPQAASDIVNELRQRRVLISASGPNGNILKIRPPLSFGSKDADRLLEELDGTLRSIIK